MTPRHSFLDSAIRSATPERQAFTLLEVVIGMTLLSLLTTMVFGIVSTSVKVGQHHAGVQQEESNQVNRFIALCRNAFQSLPSTAILTLTVTQAGDPAQQELTIAGAPEAFPFGSTPISYKDTVLGIASRTRTPWTQPMPPKIRRTSDARRGALYFIGLSRQDLIPTDPNSNSMLSRSDGSGIAAADDQGRFWMPLMSNTVSLYWRFYRVDDDSWQEEWSSTTLPQLVEMNLQLRGRTQPIRVVFALPLTKLTGPNAALAPPPTAAGGAAGAARWWQRQG